MVPKTSLPTWETNTPGLGDVDIVYEVDRVVVVANAVPVPNSEMTSFLRVEFYFTEFPVFTGVYYRGSWHMATVAHILHMAERYADEDYV